MELRPKDPGAARSPTNPSSEPASPEYPPSARSSLLRSVSAYLAPTTLVEKRPVDAAAQSSTPPDSSDGTRSSKSSHA